MNLHGIVAPIISAVNPRTVASIRISTGYTTGGDGTRIPSYAAAVSVSCQVQSMQYNDLMQLSGLNLQGTKRKIYLNGQWNGLVRADRRGGDLITLPDGTVWLVVQVLEHWPDWTCVAVTMQDGA